MVSLSGKGSRKGKGNGRGKKRFSTGRSNLSLAERKRKLADLKNKTRCTACGEIGHWAGDSQCPKAKGKGKGKGNSRPSQGYMTIAGTHDYSVCGTSNTEDVDDFYQSGDLVKVTKGEMMSREPT